MYNVGYYIFFVAYKILVVPKLKLTLIYSLGLRKILNVIVEKHEQNIMLSGHEQESKTEVGIYKRKILRKKKKKTRSLPRK